MIPKTAMTVKDLKNWLQMCEDDTIVLIDHLNNTNTNCLLYLSNCLTETDIESENHPNALVICFDAKEY